MLIFHGRGGTPARGGGRTENLVESLPSGAMRGVLRLTEQGEVVNQSYSLRPIAMRTLERTFASVALATAHAAEAEPIARELIAAMGTIAAQSLKAYRELVFGSAEFFEYFRAATPLDVIERMHIASRPAARVGGERRAVAAGDSLGVCLDAKPPHVAGMVRLWQRRASRVGASRRGGLDAHDGALAVLRPLAR